MFVIIVSMKNINEQIQYWLESAKHDLKTAEALFKSKHFDWCLYLAHLVLEKTLKAFYVKDVGQMPPKTHRLESLAVKTKLNLTPEQIDFLKEINEFNLEARYPDYKFGFYKLCTKEFTLKYFIQIKELHKWLLKEIMQ